MELKTTTKLDVTKLTKSQLKQLQDEINRQLGKPVIHDGKRGRPKGSKNGTTKKREKREPKKHKIGAYNATTNVLNARPRPVTR